MPSRDILTVVPGVALNMGGFKVRQPLPHPRLSHVDPFLLLHHAGPVPIEPGSHPRMEGVPPHPHRGFEPVTFILKGGVHHRDSRGNDSIIGPGGVQWMTAGMGIVHSERPPASLTSSGGEQELIQLWINLPSRFKMVQPRYIGLEAADLPEWESPGVRVQVVSGTVNGVKGPVPSHSPLTASMIRIEHAADLPLDLPCGQGGLLYVVEGSITVNDTAVPLRHLAEFGPEGDLQLSSDGPAVILALSGEPIGEPVVKSGPYVMNTQTQILEAMRDAQMGKMGILIETFD